MAKCRRITCADNAHNYTCRHDACVTNQYRKPSVVDMFYFEKGKSSDDGKECVHVTDPIIMVFNEERLLNTIGASQVQQWFDSMIKANTSVSNALDGVSDDVKLELVRSRRIQTPSELQNYLSYCEKDISRFNKQLKEAQTKVEQLQKDASIVTDNASSKFEGAAT